MSIGWGCVWVGWGSGLETRLSQCGKTELGTVTRCENRHYAGVICYDREGRCQQVGVGGGGEGGLGTETRLSQCGKTELGTVTKCENRHYGGVICYDREGRCQQGVGGGGRDRDKTGTVWQDRARHSDQV